MTGFDDFGDAHQNYNNHKNMLYIIDDAQTLFGDDNTPTLLDSIKQFYFLMITNKKNERQNKIFVIIFATHGNNTLGIENSRIALPDDHILGIEYLLFSKEEYKEAIQNLKLRLEESGNQLGFDFKDLPFSFFELMDGIIYSKFFLMLP